MRHIAIFTLCFSLLSCAYGQVLTSTNFNRQSTSGSLLPGMKDSEVRQLLGKPRKVAARKTTSDTRAVWTYKQYYLEHSISYFLGGFFTFGMLWILPADQEYHYLVFSDGTLIGWDLPDPYAPNLIIEKRER